MRSTGLGHGAGGQGGLRGAERGSELLPRRIKMDGRHAPVATRCAILAGAWRSDPVALAVGPLQGRPRVRRRP
ncbi:hypothetical protein ABT314_01565, partial [Streptomyces spiralis]